MKVRIALTVEVDPEAWNAAYGRGASAAEVREDVQDWALHTLTEHPEGLIRRVAK